MKFNFGKVIQLLRSLNFIKLLQKSPYKVFIINDDSNMPQNFQLMRADERTKNLNCTQG